MRSTLCCPARTSDAAVSPPPPTLQMDQLQLSSPGPSASTHWSNASSTADLRPTRSLDDSEWECDEALEESALEDHPASLYSALSSTATLVHLEPLRLVFSRDSVVNTTLFHGSVPRYQVASNTSMTNITLHDLAAQRVAAVIKYRYFWPDVVVLPHRGAAQKSVRIGKWLRRPSKEDDVRSVACIRTESGCYSWRSCSSHRLALYSEKPCDDVPVANCVPAERSRSLTLIIQPSVLDIIVDVIVAFLVLEQRLRMKEYQDRHWDTQYLASSVVLM